MAEVMNEGKRLIQEFARNKLKELLGQCTEEQQAFFQKMYPKGPSAGQIEHAIDQCYRTILKNRERAQDTTVEET